MSTLWDRPQLHEVNKLCPQHFVGCRLSAVGCRLSAVGCRLFNMSARLAQSD